jgi:AcrR family transcriptional regulator
MRKPVHEATDKSVNTYAGDEPTMSSRVLIAAARAFRQKGYAASTTREIAEMVGLQKASLYHHIEGKEQLLYELCVDSLEHIQANVAAIVALEASPIQRLRAAIKAHVTAMLEDQDKHATMLVELRSLSGGRRDDVIRLRDGYEDMLAAIVVECQQAGHLRRDVEPGLLVLALLNLLNWTIFWYREDGKLTPVQVAEFLETIYLDGAAKRPMSSVQPRSTSVVARPRLDGGRRRPSTA